VKCVSSTWKQGRTRRVKRVQRRRVSQDQGPTILTIIGIEMRKRKNNSISCQR